MTKPEAKSENRGRIVLVGAGPGDPGLITVRGLEALRAADAVVYDALANPALLAEVSDKAELIDAGKRAKAHRLKQDETNALLVELARQGKVVVRLKGGDPYLFGRGAEEAMYCAEHGVACEVVPGITSGIAAPMYAGIPVTHREHASSVTFVTGHEDPTKPDSSLDYGALARLIVAGGTVCFYMGVGRLPQISAALQEGGCTAETPAAAVQWGTRAAQRSVRSTLTRLAGEIERRGMGAPAILVIGPVAAIDEPGLNFFESRPLFGRTVVVTRSRRQASDLASLLTEAGARVIEAPTIEVHPPASYEPLDATLRRAGEYAWLIVTSANAVKVVAGRMDAVGVDARKLAGVRVAAVGRATADAVRRWWGVRPDLVPRRANGQALAEEMVERFDMTGARCLLVRGDLASEDLPRMLTEAGAQVEQVTAYETRATTTLPDEVLDALRGGEVDWITFTSSSTARNLVEALGEERGVLDDVRCASIGPVTSDTMRELRLAVDVEAQTPGVAALVDAIEGCEDG